MHEPHTGDCHETWGLTGFLARCAVCRRCQVAQPEVHGDEEGEAGGRRREGGGQGEGRQARAAGGHVRYLKWHCFVVSAILLLISTMHCLCPLPSCWWNIVLCSPAILLVLQDAQEGLHDMLTPWVQRPCHCACPDEMHVDRNEERPS